MCPPPKAVQASVADTVCSMGWKPRIRKVFDRWLCAGAGLWATGDTPAEAYRYWRMKKARLAVQGRAWKD